MSVGFLLLVPKLPFPLHDCAIIFSPIVLFLNVFDFYRVFELAILHKRNSMQVPMVHYEERGTGWPNTFVALTRERHCGHWRDSVAKQLDMFFLQFVPIYQTEQCILELICLSYQIAKYPSTVIFDKHMIINMKFQLTMSHISITFLSTMSSVHSFFYFGYQLCCLLYQFRPQ